MVGGRVVVVVVRRRMLVTTLLTMSMVTMTPSVMTAVLDYHDRDHRY